MKNQTKAVTAWGSVLLAGILWGGGAIVAQSVMQSGMNSISLSLARFALGLPLLWWWHWQQRGSGIDDARWRRLPWRSRGVVVTTGVAMALNIICWFTGIKLIGATLPTVISICFAPVLVTLISVLRGYEALSVRLVAALALAVCGTGLIVAIDGLTLPIDYAEGLAWSFTSAFLYAMVVLGNARMPNQVSSVTASAWSMSVATLLVLAASLRYGITLPNNGIVWLQVGYTGVFTTSIAYLAFAWGARRLSPTSAVIGTLVEPLATALLAACLWNQPLTTRQYAGALMLAVAMFILSRRSKRDRTQLG